MVCICNKPLCDNFKRLIWSDLMQCDALWCDVMRSKRFGQTLKLSSRECTIEWACIWASFEPNKRSFGHHEPTLSWQISTATNNNCHRQLVHSRATCTIKWPIMSNDLSKIRTLPSKKFTLQAGSSVIRFGWWFEWSFWAKESFFPSSEFISNWSSHWKIYGLKKESVELWEIGIAVFLNIQLSLALHIRLVS